METTSRTRQSEPSNDTVATPVRRAPQVAAAGMQPSTPSDAPSEECNESRGDLWLAKATRRPVTPNLRWREA